MYDWPNVDADRLRTERMGRVAELMAARDVDHLLLTGFDNIRFATDYRTLIIAEGFDWFAALVDSSGATDMFVPWVDEEVREPHEERPWILAEHPMPSWSQAQAHVGYWAGSIARVLRHRGARRVGFEMVWGDLLDALRQEAPQVDFVPVGAALADLRMHKDPAELELLRAASHVNARAVEAAMRALEPGMRDYDVLSVAMAELQRQGVEYMSHSLCNVRRGSGTWFAVGNRLEEGDAFFFDIGCYGVGGYGSDMARVAFVGEPPAEVQKAYHVLLEAHRIGEETARPGVRASEVSSRVNEHLRRNGLPITPYAVGHGLGLRACEVPVLHRTDRMTEDVRLAAGMVIAIEPETGVEIDGNFVLLKVEDNYVVEQDGLSRMTDALYPLVQE